MFRNWQRLLAELGETRKLIDGIDRRMEKVEVVLMVREPSSTVAADAYDGLRKQVVNAATERWTHLAQLAQMDRALNFSADDATLRAMVDNWLEQASLVRVTEAPDRDAELLFQLVEDLGGPLEILRPAYQDAVTGRIIQQGQARRRAPRTQNPAPDGRTAASYVDGRQVPPMRQPRGARRSAAPPGPDYQVTEYRQAQYENTDYPQIDQQGSGTATDGGKP